MWKSGLKYLKSLFESIPLQLGKRFRFTLNEGGYRKRDLLPCIDLLYTSGIAHQVSMSAGQGIPLGAEVNVNYFKVLFIDVALSQAVLNITPHNLLLYPIQELINRGALVESFIGQELLGYATAYKKADLYYWQHHSREGNAEIDYLMQHNSTIIPIEVKSGQGSSLASMHTFLSSHKASPYGIRFSTQNYSNHTNIRSYPLYAVAKTMCNTEDIAKKLLS